MLDFKLIAKILGIIIMLFSLTNLMPVAVAIIYKENETINTYVFSAVVFLIIGSTLWYPYRNNTGDLSIKSGYFITFTFWMILGILGAIPLFFEVPKISFIDAMFEAYSGITTTGATLIEDVESLSRSILFYRQQLQWLGGMGIILLAIAILPTLGIGGMQLYKSEVPGPFKNQKLVPKITGTAKLLWWVYVNITIACILAYYLAGMNLYDAIANSFSTVSTGGFSTYNNSFAYFNNSIIDLVAIFFIIVVSLNFLLHFYILEKQDANLYFKDLEVSLFLKFLFLGAFIVFVILQINNYYTEYFDAIIKALFQVTSIISSTGFTNDSFTNWPSSAVLTLFMLSFIGGCAGSTAGGIKIVRISLIMKQIAHYIRGLIHPNAVFRISVQNESLSTTAINTIWVFFGVYMIVMAILTLLLNISGLDLLTSWTSVAATLNNLGVAAGETASGFYQLNYFQKLILSFSMVMGRLEIFTVLIVFNSHFWKN